MNLVVSSRPLRKYIAALRAPFSLSLRVFIITSQHFLFFFFLSWPAKNKEKEKNISAHSHKSQQSA
jgi:hypothetical protein